MKAGLHIVLNDVESPSLDSISRISIDITYEEFHKLLPLVKNGCKIIAVAIEGVSKN